MNVAIVEDETAHGELLRRYITDWAKAGKRSVNVFSYPDAKSFLFDREDLPFDVVFADIQMPGMSGMEMVRKLRETEERLPVVFTTGVADYLQDGYDVQALHYLLKPISREKVEVCLERVCRQGETPDYYLLRSEDGIRKVDLREVDYCEAAGHYSVLVTASGERLLTEKGISELERELGGTGFFLCHRSYLCNLMRIRQIMRDQVLFDSGATIPVSRRLYRELNREFIRFFQRAQEREVGEK